MEEHTNLSRPAIGILYAGEMGAALGRVFLDEGLRVVTTLNERGPRTRSLCHDAGLEVVKSLADVVRAADIVVSAVPPSAALQVARDYAALAQTAPVGRLYVDVNAVSPATAVEIGEVLAGAGVDYVDAAINGLASVLRTGAILYLSGARAGEVAHVLRRSLNIKVVGDVPGKASALKGALAGLSKGLTALFLEIAVMAREADLSEFFMERCRSFYPGVMEVVDRMLPTYPRHAGRRAQEMGELEDAMLALDLQPNMVRAAKDVTRAVAQAGLAGAATAEQVVAEIHASKALRKQNEANGEIMEHGD